jgi:hypothetical protein
MDMVRRGKYYRTKMRLFNDSTEEHWVRWFECEKGASCFPGPTVFNSTRWLNETARPADQGLGELLVGHRPWSDGRNHDELPGTCFLNLESKYLTGLGQADKENPPVVPDCCQPRPVWAIATHPIGMGPIEDLAC